MEAQRPRIIVRAPDGNHVVQTFSFTPDLLRFSQYLQDMYASFERDGDMSRAMGHVYSGTLNARAVEIIDALVGQWVIVVAGEHREEHIDESVVACLDIRRDNSNTEKIAILLVFGFLNMFHVTGLLDRVATVLYGFARYTEEWFRCNVQHAHFGDRLADKSTNLCAACGTARVVGTCDKCSTPLQVCSATCLDKVHAMCDPFSFVVPSDTECDIMQNVLFPASFNPSLGMVGFNEDERSLILSKKSMEKWITIWKKAHIKREDVADRIRWAYVKGRLPDTRPLGPLPDPSWNSDREKDLSNLVMDIHVMRMGRPRGPYVALDAKRAVGDLIIFMRTRIARFKHYFRDDVDNNITRLCIIHDCLEGLQYIWASPGPPDDHAINFILTSAPVFSPDPNARIFRHVLASLTAPLRPESIHLMTKPGDTWGLYRILSKACWANSASHVRALLDDGRVDPSLDSNDLFYSMTRQGNQAVIDVLRTDPRVQGKK